LGIATLLAIGLTRGAIFGLILISVWVTVKQAIGVWSESGLFFNLLEMVTAITTFALAGIYHDRLNSIFVEHLDIQNKLKRLDLEDNKTGLIKPAIGLLRLSEESARSFRYKRPLSLVLILTRPLPQISWQTAEKLSIMRAVATTIKDITRDTDFLFLVKQDKIALILPETDTLGTIRVINNIVSKMVFARLITQTGSSELLQSFAQIRLGFATFFGQTKKRFDLMEAAERSLQKNLETNLDLFQNLFIDWETIGELPVARSILTPDSESDFKQIRPVYPANNPGLPVIENRNNNKPKETN
jgi:GGDEF domain-containing protein